MKVCSEKCPYFKLVQIKPATGGRPIAYCTKKNRVHVVYLNKICTEDELI